MLRLFVRVRGWARVRRGERVCLGAWAGYGGAEVWGAEVAGVCLGGAAALLAVLRVSGVDFGRGKRAALLGLEQFC